MLHWSVHVFFPSPVIAGGQVPNKLRVKGAHGWGARMA